MINTKSLLFSLALATGLIIATSCISKKSVATAENTESDSITWLDFQEGYDKAVKEKKMIVIDVYTDWCGWCKRMDKSTYSKEDIIEKVNKHFVPVKLNPELDAKYKVKDKEMSGYELVLWLESGRNYGYPTTIFWKEPHKNEKVEVSVGYKSAKEFGEILDSYINK